jgi:hypothetical protein
MNSLYIIASGFIAYALIWAIIPRKRAEIVEATPYEPPPRDEPLPDFDEFNKGMREFRNYIDNLQREGKI